MKKIDEEIKSEILFSKYEYITIKEMRKRLEQSLTQLIYEIDNGNDTSITRKKKRLAKLIKEALLDIYSTYYPNLLNEIKEVNTVFVESEKIIVDTALFVSYLDEIMKPKDDIMEGYSFKKMFKLSSKSLEKKLKERISEQMILNKNPSSFYRKLKKEVSELMDYQLKTAARTFSKYIREQVKDKIDETYEDENQTGWTSLATLDSRTTPLCISLDKVFYSKEDYKKRKDIPNKPPRHFNCRSILSRTYRDNEPTSRASKGDEGGSQISYETSFNDFLKRNPETAKLILGEKRFKLWSEGKYDVKDFINSTTGKFFSLEEIKDILKVKENEYFFTPEGFLRIYHGDDYGTFKISPEFMANGNMQFGPGIYFGTKEVANEYGSKIIFVDIDESKFIPARKTLEDANLLDDMIEFIKVLHEFDPEPMFNSSINFGNEIYDFNEVTDNLIEDIIRNNESDTEVRDFFIDKIEDYGTVEFSKVFTEMFEDKYIGTVGDTLNLKGESFYAIINTNVKVNQIDKEKI